MEAVPPLLAVGAASALTLAPAEAVPLLIAVLEGTEGVPPLIAVEAAVAITVAFVVTTGQLWPYSSPQNTNLTPRTCQLINYHQPQIPTTPMPTTHLTDHYTWCLV
jgi:hypothetical protein